jgi:hypothetical protein
LDELKRRHQIHLENLAVLKTIEKEEFGKIETLSLAEKFHYLTLRRGIRFEADWVLWCEEAIEMIESDREENP